MEVADAKLTDSGQEGWRASIFSLAAWRRHLIWFAGAVATGGAALYFNYAEIWSVRFFHFVDGISPFLPALIVTGGMVLICRLRDKFFKGTDGTGIPQAIAALKIPEGAGRSFVLSGRIAFGKMLLLTLGLFSGATIGREGPSVHVGACLMYLCSKLTRFPQHLVRRGLILAGGGAGIAAAFNAPIAGAVFAFEEIGRSFEKSNAGTIVRTVAVACIVCIIALSDYLFYGQVGAALHTPRQWLAVPIIGIFGGLLGGLFARAVASITPKFSRFSRRRPYVVAASLGLALAVLGLISGGLSYGSGYAQARSLLIDGEKLPIFFPLVKATASFVSLISRIPGGLFDPSLSVGAALGQLVLPLFSRLDPQAVILMCMVAYFCGVIQSPITAFVILVEMTSAHSMIMPLMVTSILAYEASHLVCRTSLYESLADSFLEQQAESANAQPTAAGHRK